MIRAVITTSLIALASCATSPTPVSGGSRTLLFQRTATLPAISISNAIPVTVTDAPGVDVASKTIIGSGFRAQATYGLTGGRQACGSLPNCRLHSRTISGRPATYVQFTGPQTIEGTTYSHRLIGYLPVAQVRPDEPGSGVLINGWCNEPKGCSQLEGIFLSLRVER